jgi:ketosteroid isomerase-like protein
MAWHGSRAGILAVFLAAAPAAAQSYEVLSDQQILVQIERDWDAAFLRADAATVEKFLAEEFLAIYADGSRGDKARELALVAAFNQQIDSSRLDEFLVKIYGDTAIVTFSRHLVGPSQGRRLEVSYRYMDVFVMRDGRWLCVASQSTKVTTSP